MPLANATYVEENTWIGIHSGSAAPHFFALFFFKLPLATT
jgi:hypothetical protein